MDASSKYWTICQISLAHERTGYEHRLIPPAQEFFQRQFSAVSNFQSRDIQIALFTRFQARKTDSDVTSRAQAGLCLRCHVSYPILKACQTIENSFAGDKPFTYRDLLPFVLNDDGKALVILDDEGTTQLKLNSVGETQPATYKLFAMEVLRTYKPNAPTSMSLENWVFLQTKQHPELKNFLSEFGFQPLSDWAMLNRVRPKQLEQLTEPDRLVVQVFHAVYRRDRRQQQRVGKCLDPSSLQLQEMCLLLKKHGKTIKTPGEVLKALKQVVQQLRQYDIWSFRTPLEIQNLDTGTYELRPDLPTQASEDSDIEQQEFLAFLHLQLSSALTQSLTQAIAAQMTQLEKSRKYAPFAASFIPGLQLYYCQGLSLREIGPQLGMSSWDQTRRVLNPGDLLNKVRTLTVEQALASILEQAQAQGLVATPPALSYVKNLAEQVEAFVDREIFEEAAAEIKAGKNRLLDSVYAQQLKRYFEQHA